MILNKQTMIISHSNCQDILTTANPNPPLQALCIFPLVTEAAVYSCELILTEKK